MKEKIIEILESYQAKGLDRIRNVKNLSGWISPAGIPLIADELEPLINQEVEKRIKERIPKPKEAKEKRDNRSGNYLNPRSAMSFDSGFDYAYKWILSCLICSEKPNNSQKSEGGEG